LLNNLIILKSISKLKWLYRWENFQFFCHTNFLHSQFFGIYPHFLILPFEKYIHVFHIEQDKVHPTLKSRLVANSIETIITSKQTTRITDLSIAFKIGLIKVFQMYSSKKLYNWKYYPQVLTLPSVFRLPLFWSIKIFEKLKFRE